MSVIERIHYRPREGASFEAPLDILMPALGELRKCDDSLKTLVLLDSLPDIILPALAFVASRKTYIPHIAVKTLVKGCGQAFLERTLGSSQARALWQRYAEQQEVLSGL